MPALGADDVPMLFRTNRVKYFPSRTHLEKHGGVADLMLIHREAGRGMEAACIMAAFLGSRG